MPDIGVKDVSEVTEHATLATIVAQHVANQPYSPAIVTSREGVLTYSALGAQIAAFGKRFRASGVGSSARVAISLPDGPELAIAIVATACHAIAIPLNPRLTAAELDNLFTLLRFDALIISDSIDSAARNIAARRGTFLIEVSSKLGSLQILQSAGTSAPFDREPERSESPHPQSPAIILQTSATTGRPKLVPITHRNLTITAKKRKYWLDLTSRDRSLCATPLYYGQALKGALLTPLLLGGSVACADRNANDDVLKWLTDLRPTWLDSVPTFYINLLDRVLEQQNVPLYHCLRFIRSGAAPLPMAVRQRLEEIFGVPVLEGYGLTETGTIAINSLTPEHRKPGTVGKPSPYEVAICGADGHLLSPNSTGEIIVRGPAVMPGYLYDEEANRAAFVDGWFRTGDLGAIDTDGYLTYLGRRKEFINRGGEKISLYEIDKALSLHPLVRDAAAFPIPHPRLGENVAAAVVLVPGAITTPNEIKSFLVNHLAAFKIPAHLAIMSELPKGSTGKTLRSELSRLVANRIRDVVAAENELELWILEIWQKLLGRSDVGIDENFFEAGGDSLLAVQMVCEVEALTHQRMPPPTLRSAYTVRELAAAVVRGMPATPELVTRIKDGSGTPFLFCHGDWGKTQGLYALKLTDMLTGSDPVYLLHPYPNPDPGLTIEDMARAYLPYVLAAHPTGAFRIGGNCNGGLLAWEIACQLDRMGREIETVVLVDTMSLNARPILRAIATVLRSISDVAPKNIGKKLKTDGMHIVWRVGRGARSIWRTGKLYWKSDFSSPYSVANSNYIPAELSTKVFCVISDESRSRPIYSPKPWANLAPDVRCDYVPGTHLSCVREYVSTVARALDAIFCKTDNVIRLKTHRGGACLPSERQRDG